MDRRTFLERGALAFGAFGIHGASAATADSNHEEAFQASSCSFVTGDTHLMQTYHAALAVLAQNTRQLHPYGAPVLVEGAVYPGAWLECAPQEGAVFGALRPNIARNNHFIFFALQKEDGQLPCNVKMDTVGFGQIQMVVPIAATAWEIAERTGDSELLQKAYIACSRWDEWLRRYRNTRGTGLCEGFCTYDTGHDNSPRWSGIPNSCPDADVRKYPSLPGMPRLCPDLSATVYGGRVALASMAKALGKEAEADRWASDAVTIRKLILNRLYSEKDAAFYDLDTNEQFIRIRGDVISRVLGEHVVEQKIFDAIYERQIHNPKAFWAPYPLPSIAMDDTAFVRPIPRNSWGGASQALTALRAPRWMEHYGKPADLAWMMQRWVEAISRHIEFRQQMDPLTGEFTRIDPSGYSPAALVLFDYLWRLSGVRAEQGLIEWNVRSPSPSANSSFQIKVAGGTAELNYQQNHATLQLSGKEIASVWGDVRIVTTREGALRSALGISTEQAHVRIRQQGHKPLSFQLAANAHMSLA